VDALKGIAEVVEHILYELLGLLIPGACFALSVAFVWGAPEWTRALRFADEQPLIALGAAYLLGFVVQGISRPVTVSFEWLAQRPARLLSWGYRPLRRRWKVPAGWGNGGTADERFASRHGHEPQVPAPIQGVELALLAEERWRKRLALNADIRLSDAQVRDLSFSAIPAARSRLDRFRAAASLCRGVATSVAISAPLLLLQIATAERSLDWAAVGWLEAVLIAFYALMERADMYNKRWNSVLVPQFLATSTEVPSSRPESPG
jgi:hypothetical protein